MLVPVPGHQEVSGVVISEVGFPNCRGASGVSPTEFTVLLSLWKMKFMQISTFSAGRKLFIPSPVPFKDYDPLVPPIRCS